MKDYKKSKDFKEWEKRTSKEMKLLFSPMGEEMQYNLVAQGYKDLLFGRLMVLFGSGFVALDLIKPIEKEINESRTNR